MKTIVIVNLMCPSGVFLTKHTSLIAPLNLVKGKKITLQDS